MKTLQVGDILEATYAYSGKHNYYLLVTRRTAKTVDLARLDREIVSDDGYGQNGNDKPKIVDGKPVLSRFNETYKGKRIKIGYDGNEAVKIGDYISLAQHWDGVSSFSFYTD